MKMSLSVVRTALTRPDTFMWPNSASASPGAYKHESEFLHFGIQGYLLSV